MGAGLTDIYNNTPQPKMWEIDRVHRKGGLVLKNLENFQVILRFGIVGLYSGC